MRRPSLETVAGPAWGAALVCLLALLPLLLSDFRAFQLARVGVFFIAILGLNILTGYTGQISLGHGALMAVGGYTTAILAVEGGMDEVWTIPLAGLVAGGVGLLLGPPSLRLSGLYLALATFGLAVAVPALLRWRAVDQWTGGSSGRILSLPKARFGLPLSANDWLYYLTWTVAIVLLALAWLLLRGRAGRAFRAIRDHEVAAACCGVDLARYKTLAFGVSAFYAGVAGSLYAVSVAFVNPDTYPVKLSLFLVVGAVVAGLGSLSGILLGALLVQFLPTDLTPAVVGWLDAVLPVRLDSRAPGIPDAVFGVLLVLTMLLLPEGAAGAARRAAALASARLYTRRRR